MSTFKIYTTPTYEEFKTYVKDNILQYLPEQFQNLLPWKLSLPEYRLTEKSEAMGSGNKVRHRW